MFKDNVVHGLRYLSLILGYTFEQKSVKSSIVTFPLRGVNLNYRFGTVAKGLLRTIFCGKLF